jgi:hypothetical protein
MSLKSLFGANDEKAILEEYKEILKEDAFAPSTQKRLEEQQQKIQAAINILMVEEELS